MYHCKLIHILHGLFFENFNSYSFYEIFQNLKPLHSKYLFHDYKKKLYSFNNHTYNCSNNQTYIKLFFIMNKRTVRQARIITVSPHPISKKKKERDGQTLRQRQKKSDKISEKVMQLW